MEYVTRDMKQGFTLIELLIVMAILIIAGGVLATFGRDFFSLNRFFEDSLLSQRSAEEVIRMVTSEVRAAVQSSAGNYPLQIAGSQSFSFFSNVDGDALRERVQYFLNGTSLVRSVVKPAGNPLTYSTTTAQESLRTVLRDLVSSSTAPVFSYYDKNYTGTSTPLAQPVNVLDIRLVKVTFIIDENPNTLPPPLVISSQVSIRNLKENY